MHRALLIYDIVCHIFQCCTICSDGGDLQTPDHKLLANLARTCRSFHEPALDTLWADLDSIHPLIRCLPPDVWIRHESKVFCKKYLSPLHQATLHKYASRVRVLRISDNLNTTFQTLVAFEEACASGPLCPQLRHLEWFEIDPEMLPNLHLFLSPTLLVLKLDLWTIEGSDLSILLSLGTQCPLVRTAVFEGPLETEELSSAVSQAVCGWRHLQELQCGKLDRQAWAHLSETGTLTSGAFRLPSPLAAYITSPQASSECMTLFPEMSDIHISSRTVRLALDFVELMHHTPRRFQLTAEFTRTSQAIHALFVALSNRALDSPSHLKLYGSDLQDNSASAPTISFETMHPLLGFRNLRVLQIESFGTFSLDDEALKAFAMAWPNLETLWLYHSIWPRPLGITFQGLSHLVKFCPNLKRLALAFDATNVYFVGGELQDASNHTIKLLYALNSPLSDPGSVARLLKCLFPRLKRVFNSGAEAAWLWDDVNDRLPAL
ncbi:hypothetical protein BJ138DRAFT_772702 [Hygrophoropsis aurantiaca]|uniref:Uncharacterized protein n=1 Tax=Hygrophoropsis aurantiaca TaxID=72124 RepID=A0ACB7ZXE6_9AGAM|nr:hypothetical protein BJ138DRAFT_772702 [Hygrophoropsis aurantiaca]